MNNQTDSILTSAIRGRILAVLMALGALYVALPAAWAEVRVLFADGLTSDELQTIGAHATALMTNLDALLVSVMALVGMGASAVSKYREGKKNNPTL